jgi:hypothetical protein
MRRVPVAEMSTWHGHILLPCYLTGCGSGSKSMAERPACPWPQMDLLFIHGTECNLAACMVAVIDTIPDRLPTNGYIHHRLCVCLPGDYPTRSLEFLQVAWLSNPLMRFPFLFNIFFLSPFCDSKTSLSIVFHSWLVLNHCGYRLENEHLNNVGHYRAIKTVPLPFEELNPMA